MTNKPKRDQQGAFGFHAEPQSKQKNAASLRQDLHDQKDEFLRHSAIRHYSVPAHGLSIQWFQRASGQHLRSLYSKLFLT